MVTTFAFNGVGASVSESYFQQKHALTRYYFTSIYKWLGTFAFFMIGLLFFGAVLINVIVGENYSLVLPIIQSYIFFKLIYLFLTHIDHFFNGVGKPEYGIYLISIEQVARIFILWLLLVPFPSGWIALVYSTGIAWLIKFIIGFLLFNFKILKVRINLWQTLAAPALPQSSKQSTFGWVELLVPAPLAS